MIHDLLEAPRRHEPLVAGRLVGAYGERACVSSWVLDHRQRRGRQEVVQDASGRRHELSVDEALPLFDERDCPADPVADWWQAATDPAAQAELRTTLTAAIEELPHWG